MDEAVLPGDIGRPPPRPEDDAGDVDRLEAVEQQVRQLTSRLAGWVEAQLVQALDDRRNDMKALRAELQGVVNEQLAGVRAEASSVLIVATRRLEVAQEQLSGRLDTVAERAAEAAAKAIALSGSSFSEAERMELLEEQVDQRLALVPDLVKAQVAAAAGPGRADAFEQRVRAAMGRLTESVEARLAEVTADRESNLEALRSGLIERVDGVEREARLALAGMAEMEQSVRAGIDRAEALEQKVQSHLSRLDDSVDSRLAAMSAASASREAEVDALRAEEAASAVALGRSLDGLAQDTATTAESVAALRSDTDAGATRLDDLEQRVKAAMGRLADSVESRLTEFAAGRSVDMRAEIETATSALRARFGQVHDRIDAVEQQHAEVGARIDNIVEAKLSEVVERRRVELEGIRSEMEEALATQLGQARTEIGTAVADAHRRFVISVDELDQRMETVAGQAAAAEAAVARFEVLEETVGSDGRRIEALEVHTRRTDARLGEVVDEKLAEISDERGAELEGVLRNAHEAHLAETRAEVTSALGEGRRQLAAGMATLDRRQAELDGQATDAATRLDALAASVEVALRKGEAQVARTLDTRLAILDTVAARVATIDTIAKKVATIDTVARKVAIIDTMAKKVATIDALAIQVATVDSATEHVTGQQSETAAGVAALERRLAKVQEQVETNVASMVEQVDTLARAAAGEAGSLAPLRSDLRLLQAQVAELAGVVAELRPRRKAPAVPAKKESAARRRASNQ